MYVRKALFCLMIVATAVPAFGQAAPSRRAQQWEVTLETRYTPSQDVSASGGSKIEAQDDLGWGFGFGFNVNRKLNLGLGVNWRTVPYVATIVDATDPSTTQEISSEFDMSNLELRGNYNFSQKTLTPYVAGSWGWMLLDSNIQASTEGGCWWYPWWGYVCGTYSTDYGMSTWTAGLGGGVRWEPDPDGGFLLKAGYDYLWTGADLLDSAHVVKVEFGLLM